MAIRKTTLATVIIVAVVGLLLTVSTIGVLGAPKGSGKVQAVNVGVYSDAACTTSCSAIDWGHIKAGGVVTRIVHVKNLGSTVVSLRLSTSSWNPVKAASLITLSWNVSSSYQLQAGKVVPVLLSLKAAPSTGSLSDFSFNVVVTGGSAVVFADAACVSLF